MKTIILCDFDGTITIKDTCVQILTKFAGGDWKTLDDKLLEGTIYLEECMRLQFQMVRANKKEILQYLEDVVHIRDGFKEFVEFCVKKGFDLIIVSAGLDFVIRHFLDKLGLNNVDVFSGKASIGVNGIELEFPIKRCDNSVDFKDDLVSYYKRMDYNVVYIGDGLSDFQAISKANAVFVVKGSRLADKCQDQKIECMEFTSFRQIQKKYMFSNLEDE